MYNYALLIVLCVHCKIGVANYVLSSPRQIAVFACKMLPFMFETVSSCASKGEEHCGMVWNVSYRGGGGHLVTWDAFDDDNDK